MGSEGPQPFGEVNLDRHGVRAYLVKMPEFLMAEFETKRPALPAGAAVGRLRIPDVGSMAPASTPPPSASTAAAPAGAAADEEQQQQQRARIILDNPVDPDQDNPREFELHFPNDPADIVLLTWKPHGEDPDMRVEGRVKYQCVVRPKLDDSYRRVNRQRVEDASQTLRETVHMDEGERIDAQNRAMRVTAMAESTAQREERQKKKDASRRHLALPDEQWREAAKTAIFRAFEAKLHYSADQLARDIDEPVSRLRSVMNEVCFYNKSGPFSGKYELKDEFKTVAQRQLKEQEMQDHRIATIEDVKRRREERATNERERSEPASKKYRHQ
jgi:transcription initiation factor TFIIF subunit beta